MHKTALIVDDSRSARIVLKRMLEAHQLNVDTAESAEAALDYLNGRRPDVIFMDHLMPGMDGFEAVTAIKNNPDTATIPIMMYTSQEGELYVGQARALGAVGVLPKEVEPVEVSKVLASLHVIDTEPESPGADPDAATRSLDDQIDDERLDGELKALLQDLFDQQRIILRREFRDTYRNLASRFADELKKDEPDAAVDADDEAARKPLVRQEQIAVVLLAALTVIFAVLFWQREFELRSLKSQNLELSRVLSLRRGDTATVPAAMRQIDDYRQSLTVAHDSVLDTLEWGVNRSGSFEFEEIPLGERRHALFRELFSRLVSMGFAGEVLVNVHVGNFCMMASGPDGYQLAEPELPADQCDRIGLDAAESLSRGYRQSVGFANFVNVAEEETGGAIRFNIVSRGNVDNRTAYPSSTAGLTAAEWNEIAAANNRVEVALRQEEG